MPIYEFACNKCGHRFEIKLSFNDKEPKCPQCGGSVKKIIFPVNHMWAEGKPA